MHEKTKIEKLHKLAEIKAMKEESQIPQTLSSEETQKLLHELRVHQIELEMQNDKLHQTESYLNALQERYFSLYDLAPVGYFILNTMNVILDSNLKAADLLGMPKGAIINQPFTSFINPETADQDTYYLNQKKLLETGTQQSAELRLLKNANSFWALLEISQMRDAKGDTNILVVANDVTERRRTEEALRHTEQRLRLANKATNDVIWDWDVATDLQQWNEAGTSLFGWTEIVEHPVNAAWWVERVHPDDRQRIHDTFFTVVNNPHLDVWRDEYRFLKADGTYAEVLDRGYVLRDDTGKAVRMVGAMVDITERKRAEELTTANVQKQQLLLERLNLALAAGKAGTWDWDIVNNTFNWDTQFLDIFGMPHDVKAGFEAWTAAVHPDDREIAVKRIGDSIDNKTELDSEYRIILPGKEIRWIRATGRTFYAHGKPVRMLGLCADITERKQAEEALLGYHHRLGMVLSNVPLILSAVNTKGEYILSKGKGLGLIGRKADDLPKDTVYQIYKNRPEILEYINRAMAGESVQATIELSGQTLEVNYEPMKDSTGNIHGVVSLSQVITERKRAEEALRSSEMQLSQALQMGKMGPWELDIASGMFTFTDSFYAIFHTTAEHEGGYTMSVADYARRFVHPEDSYRVAEETRKAIETGDPYFSRYLEHRMLYADGGEGHIAVRFFVVKDNDGRTIKTYGVNQDITELKRMYVELQKSQKLESLGVLAGGIAHDFNNLLGGIFGYIDIAGESTKDDTVSRYLSKAMNTIDRARALTQQLLTFAKGGAPVRKIAYLFPFVQETAQFALSGSNVSCLPDVPKDLWACNFDRNQIGQVIDNIVINAQQAMPVGGTIELAARNVSVADREHPLLAAGNYVRISVKDSGIGIPKELIPKIFDPFFTTKTKGHGLGLATCYSIVSRHGGCIDVESEPGKGSTFHVYLPASMGSAPSALETSVQTHRGSGTFLVMDDEEVMRETVGDMLEMLGYSVVCKVNGREAVDFFIAETKENRTCAGMIFDLTVPGGMGGRAAVEEIRKIDPDIPVFVASGYADDPVMKNPAEYGFTASVCKPFRKVELSEILNRCMRPGKS